MGFGEYSPIMTYFGSMFMLETGALLPDQTLNGAVSAVNQLTVGSGNYKNVMGSGD